jgi:hypothetical protein
MVTYKLSECEICGAVIHKDSEAFHARWHAGLDDLWSWVERVSGASCETARKVLGDNDPLSAYGPRPRDRSEGGEYSPRQSL